MTFVQKFWNLHCDYFCQRERISRAGRISLKVLLLQHICTEWPHNQSGLQQMAELLSAWGNFQLHQLFRSEQNKWVYGSCKIHKGFFYIDVRESFIES